MCLTFQTRRLSVMPLVCTGLFCLSVGGIANSTDVPSPVNVVGTTNPYVQLSQSAPAYSWTVEASNTVFSVRDLTAGQYPMQISAGALSNSVRIGTNRYVGFGQSAPLKCLHATTSGPDTTLRLETIGAIVQAWDLASSAGSFELLDHTNSNAIPLTVQKLAPTDSFFISSNGSVGMGTNQPSVIGATNGNSRTVNVRANSGPARMVIQGAAGGELNLVHINAPINQRNLRIRSESGVTNFHVVNDALTGYTVASALAIKMSNGNIGLRVASPVYPLQLASGAYCSVGGVWTNGSSRELKQDIEPLSSEQARDAVQKLQPVGYRYKNELDERYVGFIAEDVPELVAMNGRKSLSAMDITAVLTKVVQDQQSVIAQQKQQLETMTEQQQGMNERLVRLEQMLGAQGAAAAAK